MEPSDQNTLRLSRPGGSGEKKHRPGTALIRAGVILLCLGLIAFAVYQVARHVTVGLSVLRTQEITDDSFVSLELYLFRDEERLSVPGGNVFLYDVQDGEKVPVGRTLAAAYASFDGDGLDELQRQLNAYGRRIALLKSSGGKGTLSDALDALNDADRAYDSLLTASREGNLSAMNDFSDELLDRLNESAILAGNGSGTLPDAAALKEARLRLLAGLGQAGTLSAARSGWFWYDTDGYETIFDYDRVMTMTPEDFRAMTAAPAEDPGPGCAGKLVCTSTWYAAAYVPLADAACFSGGSVYDIQFNDSTGTVIPMTCVRLVPDSGGALLVFSAQAMPEGFSFDRRLSAETVYTSISGYRIPTDAVVTLKGPVTGEDVTGVWVLEGSRVVFRRISIAVRRDGYLIARTAGNVQAVLDGMTEEDAARVNADGWSFLQMNDNIITSGNDLYEGKMIS